MSRISKCTLGGWQAGRSSRRRSQVQSLTVAVTDGPSPLLPSHPTSNPFISRRILLFPFGNSNAPPNDTVSVYLDYADPKKSPEGWHACAQFALVISNIHDPTIYTVSREYRSCNRIHLLILLVPKTPTIVSLPRSAIGVSLASANSANCSTSRKVTSAQPSKKNAPMSPCTFAYLKIPPACCGTTLSSNFLVSPVILSPLTLSHQLRFKEGDWICRVEKPRSHLLHEFAPPISLLHALL